MCAAPMNLESLAEVARSFVEAKDLASATVSYQIVIKNTNPPRSGLARVLRGEACEFFAQRSLSEGKIGTAGDWYRQALDADPRCADYRASYAIKVLLALGMVEAAGQEAKRAVKIEPDNVRAWRALGGIEHELGNAEACRAAYQKARELAPDDPNPLLDLATIELDTANYREVEQLCYEVLAAHPDRSGDAYHCLAMVLYREGKHQQAIELYTRSISEGCHDPVQARWNRSLAEHSIGEYSNGWRDYEARGELTNSPISTPMRRFTAPLWKGEPPPARIHLHEEMGYGDTLALCRYALLLAGLGYDTRLEVREELVSLLQRSFPGVKVVPKAVDYPYALGLEPFDYHLPLLSCPHAFCTTTRTIPWKGPYLKPDPNKVANWKACLPKGLKIGLCWSSGIRNGIWLSEYGRRKSLPLWQLMNWLVGIEEKVSATYISLQVGPERAESATSLGRGVYDLLPSNPTWDDTAALVSSLDLVITVDTALAHLVGGLGKPLWLLMHTEGSWHWMTERLDSPWYPTARLFRQKIPHQWDEAIYAVREALNVEYGTTN